MIVNRIVRRIEIPSGISGASFAVPKKEAAAEAEPVNRVTRRISNQFTRIIRDINAITEILPGKRPNEMTKAESSPGVPDLKRTQAGLLLQRIKNPSSGQAVPETPQTGRTAKTGASRQEIDKLIIKVAARHDLPARLIKAVALAESGLDPRARSKRGAMGLMQLMPDTAREMGIDDPFDPLQNLEGGSRYLKRLLSKYGGDLKKALVAYNWGPGRMDRLGSAKIPAETSAFISRVMAFRKNIG